MEQDVDNNYRVVCCSTCLSSDRNLIAINKLTKVYQIFRLIMYDFAGDRYWDSIMEMDQLVCWECLALLRRFVKFKQQVQSAQEHMKMLSMNQTQESLDHTYMSMQTLSGLVTNTKLNYDKIFFDYTANDNEWPTQYISMTNANSVKNENFDVAQVVKENIHLDMDDNMLEVPEIVLDNSMGNVMSHIVVGGETLVTPSTTYTVKGEIPELAVGTLSGAKIESLLIQKSKSSKEEKEQKVAYVTEYMSEAEMLANRDQAKEKVQYASSVYRCELCVIGFYTQQQVEDHFLSAHRAREGTTACRVCYVYIEENKLQSHLDSHYIRHICKLCSHVENSTKLINQHVNTHMTKPQPSAVIKIGGVPQPTRKSRKKKVKEPVKSPPKPGDLRKLLSKTTIEGYQCLECDMFFKNSRARQSHVARFHREGLQCDHCKKRFVNKTTLTTHLRLHEGPLPREECPLCHKMVRVIQLKYHIQRHQNRSRYECTECNKIFSYFATYQGHLKYSRAHASDQIFKFPCPMCNKGYPTKEAMQDHFNYQHLGKTSHKCPVCDKPIASRANVEKHMLRVHGEKKEKPRNHVCQTCGKTFTDKKALTQHEVIHSGDRPLVCDICQQTFKQKASLYTHRKRVHKVFPPKKIVEYMDSKSDGC